MKVDVDQTKTLEHADTSLLIAELYNRDVELLYIFGRYYEFDEMGSHKGYKPLLTVEDAELVSE